MQRRKVAARGRLRALLTLVVGSLMAVALALPAIASAHPGVYELTARIKPSGTTCTYPDESCLQNQTQYAISNDGWAMGYVEDNGLVGGPGMINYKKLPGTWRTTMTSQQKLEFGPAQTGVQPHATCSGVAALENPANILAWQSSDPFFAYIPWQRTTAHLGDEPAEWIPVVQSATGVDLAPLSTVTQFESACTMLGGVYHEADTASEIDKATAAQKVQEAVTPLEGQVSLLTGEGTSLRAQIADWSSKASKLEGEKAPARHDGPFLAARAGLGRRDRAERDRRLGRRRALAGALESVSLRACRYATIGALRR